MKNKISNEVAIADVKAFLGVWHDEELTEAEVIEQYPNIIKGVETGNVVFNDDKVPSYTLINPIKDEDGEVVVSDISFRTRVKPSTQASLASGLDISKDTLKLALNIMSYIINQPIAYIDKMSKKDYTTLQQLASVFS